MSADRASVDRALYLSALADAIAWQESILATHDPTMNLATSCCKPGERCEQYKIERAKHLRYQAAEARAAWPGKDRKAGG